MRTMVFSFFHAALRLQRRVKKKRRRRRGGAADGGKKAEFGERARLDVSLLLEPVHLTFLALGSSNC
jgi:hypothetical protein